MTQEKLDKASKLSGRIRIIENNLADYDKRSVGRNPNNRDYYFVMSEHSDGTGLRLDLAGAGLGEELRELVVERVKLRLEELKQEFEDI